MQIIIIETEETPEEDLRAFESSPAGQAFLTAAESAARFTEKHSHGIKASEMNYLSQIAQRDPEGALRLLYAVGFLRGYSHAKEK